MGSQSDRFAGPTLRLSLKNLSILFALLGHRDCIGLVHFDDPDLFYIRERGMDAFARYKLAKLNFIKPWSFLNLCKGAACTPTSLAPLAAHVLRRQLHRRYER